MGGRTSTASKNKWRRANTSEFRADLPKTVYAEITELLKQRGESHRAFIEAAYQAAKEGKF